jgi:hypothetical protein
MAGEVSLLNVPHQLSVMLGLNSDFAGGILASLIVMSLFLFPTIFLTKGKMPLLYLIETISWLSFSVAIAWIPYWTLIIVAILTALMFAGKLRNIMGGVGAD